VSPVELSSHPWRERSRKFSVSIYAFHEDDLKLPNANSGQIGGKSRWRRRRERKRNWRKVTVEGVEEGKGELLGRYEELLDR
jgi:hypothetical protein